MKALKMDRITLSAFLALFLCFMISMVTFLSLSIYSYIKTQNSIYIETKERQADQITESISSQLLLIKDMSMHLMYSRWLARLNNHIGLYENEFDLPKRIEIRDDMAALLSSLNFAAEIIVFVPQKNIFISSKGWFDINNFVDYYRNAQYMLIYQDGTVQSLTENILPVNISPVVSTGSSVCVVIDTNRIKRFVGNAALGQFDDFAISKNGRRLIDLMNPSFHDKQDIITSPLLPLDFQISFVYARYQIVGNVSNYSAILVITFLIIIVGALISFLLAKITTKPIRNIMNKLVKQNNAPIQDYISEVSEYIDNILSEKAQLVFYEKQMRNLAFYNLLTDRFLAFSPDEYILELIPWWNQNLPYRILLMIHKLDCCISGHAAISQVIAQHSVHVQKLDIPNCDLTYLFWECKQTELEECLDGTYSDQWHIAFSDSYHNLEVISTAYIQAKTRMDFQLEINGTQIASEQLSITEEMHLLKALQEGKPGDCERIVSSILDRNLTTLKAIIRLFIRLSFENNINCNEQPLFANNNQLDHGNAQYLTDIVSFCRYFCESIRKSRSQSTSAIVNQIQNYISKNYSDCDMSLKKLSDVFQLSTTLLSKIIKSESGVNFADFLLETRLRHAKEMLLNTNFAISEISQNVGYENYLSFKRAFIRVEKISPRDYRSQSGLATNEKAI